MADSVLPLWYAARDEPSGGIYIRTPEPNRLKSLLYVARRDAKDTSILSLVIRTSPLNPNGELLILQGPDLLNPTA